MKFSRSLVNYESPQSYGNKLRKKRSSMITRMIKDACYKYGECRILDVGGTHTYWNILPKDWLRQHKVSIVLLNLDKHPVPLDATDIFESVAGNACNLSQYADNSFELVHSNSVIEHVGTWSDMKNMAAESMRVAKTYYHQTPYFWFPIEPHFMFPFLHWMPLSLRVKIAQRMALGTWNKAPSLDRAMLSQTSAILLDRHMMRTLFPGSQMKFEKLFGVPKSIIVYNDGKE